MISFTFIIPHYNLPSHYLRRMLDSIPHRDDVQIIVIDDHSPYLYDEKNEIIEKKKDSFPGLGEKCTEVVFLPHNGGPGNARNEALKLAKGEWVTFADADDYYITDSLELLMSQLKNDTTYDAIYVGFDWLNLDGSHRIDLNGYEPSDRLIKITDKKRHLLDDHHSPRKFVKRELIKKYNIHFSNCIYCEDVEFSVDTLLNSSRIAAYNKTVYCYDRRNNSITNNLPLHVLKSTFIQLLRENNKIKVTGASLSVLGYILYKMSTISLTTYWSYVLYEFYYNGFKIAKKDYLQSCAYRNVSPNIFRQITDPIRVKIGGCIKRLRE